MYEGSWSSYLESIFFVQVAILAQFIAMEIMLPWQQINVSPTVLPDGLQSYFWLKAVPR